MANINQIQLPDGSNYNLKDSVSGYASESYVDSAVAAIDKTSVGLGNVDNTSDLNKPVSTATQTALNAKTNNTVIAPVEASTTASRRYEIGDQFILSGVLYTATAIIANGGTITVGTNCTASDTIVEQLGTSSPSADNVSFDPTGTDLVSEDVESAIKEVNAKTELEYVEFISDGVKTRAQCANALFALLDVTKLRPQSVLYALSVYCMRSVDYQGYYFTNIQGGSTSVASVTTWKLAESGSQQIYVAINVGGTSATDYSTYVDTAGKVYRLYY